ncbi:restin homolog isoform X4 [Chelonus insularis]|uniref:restin homolog isoform X4 n=1 Tax=Chelonus insularis TaxID=460826 RepID=UPI00158CFFD1|nr:restin homolog isoform X4 [Chelonus insularis]
MSDKASGLRLPSKIGRPCCTVPPKPAVPPSSPKPLMNSMEPIYENPIRRPGSTYRHDDTSVVLTEDTDSFIIGDRVWVGGTKPGSIAYIGETQFAPGDWAGVVLDEPIGKNDGSVAGSRYFQCAPKHGIFSRLTRLTRQPLLDVQFQSPNGAKSPISPEGRLNKSLSPSLNASTTSLSSSAIHRDIKIGDRVIVSSSQGSKTGILRFMGETEFAAGEWCGVELDDPVGKNDGSVAGKRYFECRPKHGLFAPVHKVSRSPSSKRPSICVVHKPSGAALNSSIRKTGSRESLASLSSMASTATSIATKGTSSTAREMLKEKQQEIEMLRKERDLERERVTKAATQADQAEQKIAKLQKEYDKYREEMEKTVLEAQSALEKLLEEKNQLTTQLDEEKQKTEDLQFRFEEESFTKEDIQKERTEQSVINTLNENKIKELEKELSEERERVIQLERDSTRLFELEEELTKLKNEKTEFLELQNRNWCLEEAKITLEKQILERNDLLEEYKNQIKALEEKITFKEHESVTSKNQESDLKKDYEELKKNLDEKTLLVDKIVKERDEDAEMMKKETERLKEMMDKIIQENEKEKESIMTNYQKIIEEKNSIIQEKIKELEIETMKHTESQKTILAQLKTTNEAQISELSSKLQLQLGEKDKKIQELSHKLEENSLEIENLLKKIANQENASLSKDDALQKAIEQIEELNKELKLAEEMNEELKRQIDTLKSLSNKETASILEEKLKLQESLTSLQNSSESFAAQLEKLKTDLKMKETELVELQNTMDAEIKGLIESFESKLEEKSRSILEINADISAKSTRISNLEQEVVELKALLATKDEEINSLLEKTSELKDGITLSEQTKTNLESELRMYEVNIAELNQKITHAEEKIGQLTEQKTKLETEIASVISTSTDSSEQLLKYNEDLRLKEKEIDSLRERVYELENSITSSEAKLNCAEEDLKAVNLLVEQLRSESGDLRDQLDVQTKCKEELTAEINSLKVKEQELIEINKTAELLSEQIKNKDQTIDDLVKKLKTAEDNLSSINEKYSSLTSSSEEKVSTLQNHADKVEQKLNDLYEEMKVLKENHEKLLNEKLSSEKSIEQLNQRLFSAEEEKQKLEILNIENKSHITSLEVKIEEIRKEKEEKNVEIQNITDKYNESLAQLAASNSSLESNKSEASIELSAAREQLIHSEAAKRQLINDFEHKLKNLQEEVKQSEIEKNNYEKKIEEFKTQCEISKKKQEEMELELTNLQKEHIQNQEQLSKSMMEAKKLEEYRILAQSSHEASIEKIKELENEIKINEERLTERLATMNARESDINNELTALRGELSKSNDIINTINQMIESMKKEKEILMNEKAAREEQLAEVVNENKNLHAIKTSLEKYIKEAEERIAELLGSVKKNEEKVEKDRQILEEELNKMKKESWLLQENQNQLEKENKQLTAKLNQALEESKTLIENNKNTNEINSKIPKIVSDNSNNQVNSGDESEFAKMIEDNEMLKSQVNFLNSVIVDMQQKNEKLLCKIEVLEMGVPANEADDYSRNTIEKKAAPPRMFCDICDQFDLHETEDCPKQAQDLEDEKPLKKSKKPPVDRPYCENCEMFGHDTADCDDAETF